MRRTPRCSAPRAFAAIVLALTAACGGTTEARSNDEIEPGSGNLGPGDAPAEPADPNGDDGDGELPVDEFDEFDDVGDLPPSSVAGTTGPPCGTDEAAEEIQQLPARLLDRHRDVSERAAALQLGQEADVETLVAAAARSPVARVTTVVCVDDGAATIAVELGDGETTTRAAGSVMLVDGSWRITLHAFCRWAVTPPCGELLEARAADALSPALRANVTVPGS